MPVISLAALKNLVYGRLENNTRFYTAAEVVGSINEAIRVVNLFTGFITGTVPLPLTSTSGVGTYALPDFILLPTRVEYSGRELEFQPIHSLCESNPRWKTEVASIEGPVSTWSALGLHKGKSIILHPAPSRTGATIKVWGVVEPAALVDDADSLSMSTEFTDIVVEYAAHDRMMKCGGKVSADSMLLYREFLKRMGSLKRYRKNVNPRFWIRFDAPEEQAR